MTDPTGDGRLTRRRFLGALGAPAAVAAAAVLVPGRAARALAAANALPVAVLPPAAAADDEDFWSAIAQAFTVDRSIINLNNGGVSPSPAVVQDAVKRRLDQSNNASAYQLFTVLQPQIEGPREKLARAWGVDPEEIAITRNSSESLQTCQLGMDLQRGDEVLTTNQDYPRMLTTFRQRERRDGLVLKTITLPVPAEDDDEIVRRFADAITERTRLILMCHMINLTGQILPVKRVVAMARERGIPVVVDGAHALAHFEFQLPDLDCDYYGSSLHKWLCAPHGTGLLYVRRDKIAGLWPLMAAPEKMAGDIRKFEEIGTHSMGPCLGISEAVDFHQRLGGARKEARLVWLRDRWARRLLQNDRVRLHTSLLPGKACGLATVEIQGLEPDRLAGWLWKQHHILVTAIEHEEFRGIRVTPSVYTTPDEVDRFSDAMESALRDGLPA